MGLKPTDLGPNFEAIFIVVACIYRAFYTEGDNRSSKRIVMLLFVRRKIGKFYKKNDSKRDTISAEFRIILFL
jgi:hypothetical protein